jgi:hypothetical protein
MKVEIFLVNLSSLSVYNSFEFETLFIKTSKIVIVISLR